MSGMDDLVQFLRDQYDEDDRVARQASAGPWDRRVGYISDGPEGRVLVAQQAQAWNAEHIVRHDPARVLRKIEAKRQLLDEHTDTNDGSCGTCVDGQWGYPTHGGSAPQRYPCRTLRLLALHYADHPNYREGWRP